MFPFTQFPRILVVTWSISNIPVRTHQNLFLRFQGKSEYIGRAIARPHVKLASESYTPPQYPPSLEWYDITRGASRAGELLAVFELLEYPTTKDYGFPTLPDPKDSSCGSQAPGSGQDQGPILPVPVGIRPTLSKYR